MVKKIKDYIKNAKKAGFTEQQIVDYLKNDGWDEKQIQKAFGSVARSGKHINSKVNVLRYVLRYLSLYFQIIYAKKEGWSEKRIMKAFGSEAQQSKRTEFFINFMSKYGLDILIWLFLLGSLVLYFCEIYYEWGSPLRERGRFLLFVGVAFVLLLYSSI